MATAQKRTRSIAAVPYEARRQFLAFHSRDKRWAIIVAHRRAGKTVACVMELVTRALATKKTDARYAYITPFREQGKTVAWSYLKHYAMSVVNNPEEDFRESDLTVRLFNGAHIRIFGADNPNALRGMYLDGVVLDEFADMKASLWGEVIRPTLSDRNGWAVFIGTPRGKNEFYKTFEKAIQEPNEWYSLVLRASETGILPPQELDSAKRQITTDQYEQEYECSFEAALKGAIYARELDQVLREGRINRVPYDAASLVSTAWDIGIGDDTAIWFFQRVGAEIRIIDYHAASGEMVPYYLALLKSRGYHYDTAFLPHDARKRQWTGLTFEQAIQEAGLRVTVLPPLDLEEGINAARMLFSRCYFDSEKCTAGIEALRAYRWAYNERMGELKPTPVHNWASHPADAFRYLAQAAQSSSFNGFNGPDGGLKLPPMKWPKNM